MKRSLQQIRFAVTLLFVASLPVATAHAAGPPQSEENNRAFHSQLLKIAAEYKTYGRVDDETRWAPYLCRMPMPSMARFSKSQNAATHGRKLYYLFAKDRPAYITMKLGATLKPGQAVVKESWHPQETSRKLSHKLWEDMERDPLHKPTARNKKPRGIFLEGGSYYPYVQKDGKTYHASKKAGLYIMYKTQTVTDATDNGWVYGTVTSDGKTVTSAGRVQSCMNCHQEAKYDRLFGLR